MMMLSKLILALQLYVFKVWRNSAVKNQCRTDFNVVDEEKE